MNCSCCDLQASCGLVGSNEKPITTVFDGPIEDGNKELLLLHESSGIPLPSGPSRPSSKNSESWTPGISARLVTRASRTAWTEFSSLALSTYHRLDQNARLSRCWSAALHYQIILARESSPEQP